MRELSFADKHTFGPGPSLREIATKLGRGKCLISRLEYFLEVVAQEASAGLLDRHGLGDFASDELERAFGVEPKRCTLDIGGTDDHAGEAEFAGRSFGREQHTISQAAPAPTRIDVHAPEFRRITVVTLDTERTHDLLAFAS
jgi:hypothetical protein